MAITSTWPSALKEFVAGTKLLAADMNTYVSNALSYLYVKGGQQGAAFPSSPASGDQFYRTDFRARFVYDGSAWQQLSIGSVAANPSSPATNLRIYRTDLAQLLYYTGSAWVALSPPAGNQTANTVLAGPSSGGAAAAAYRALVAADLPLATTAARGAVIVGNDLLISSGTLNYNKGASFPVSPTTNDRFTRTDFRADFMYDGSAWQQTSVGTFSGSNPVSPTTNLRIFRSDRGREYYYDGTRWLSSLELTAELVASEAGSYTDVFSATTIVARLSGVRNDATIYITRISAFPYVQTTNNASNYWRLDFCRLDGTLIGTTSTQSSSAGANLDLTVSSISQPGAAIPAVYMDAVKVGSPGNILVRTPLVFYRLIG